MFKARLVLPTLAAAVLCSAAVFAQAPAGAPAGSTGTCNDGTYTTNATKAGACSGHKGVKAFYGPAKPAATPATAKPSVTPAPAATAKPAVTPAPTPTPAAKIQSQGNGAGAGKSTPTPTTTAASGAGPGMVWVNIPTKVYHCPTDRYYGKTKSGKYLSEQAAIAEGDKADSGKKCF